MIRVLVDYDNMTLDMTGHAEAERNTEGHDLVCCAASTLVFTLAYSCRRRCRVEKRFDKGDAHIRLEPEEGRGLEALYKLDAVVDGLRMLQEKYPACISVGYITDLHREPDGVQ